MTGDILKKHLLLGLGSLAAAAVLSGCGDNVEHLAATPATGNVPPKYRDFHAAGAEAGNGDNITQDPTSWGKLIASSSYS